MNRYWLHGGQNGRLLPSSPRRKDNGASIESSHSYHNQPCTPVNEGPFTCEMTEAMDCAFAQIGVHTYNGMVQLLPQARLDTHVREIELQLI